MITGDIVFLKNNDEIIKSYIAYDKNLVVGTNLFGVTLETIDYLRKKGDVSIMRPKKDPKYFRRNELASYLRELIMKTKRLSYKERINFIRYIVMLYNQIFKIDLIEHPAIEINNKNVYHSPELIEEFYI